MHLDDYTCVLCNSEHEETCFHLFFECPFSHACWNTIPISWNLNLQPLDMVIEARESFGNSIFREIFITACWIIWLTRNSIIFDNGQVSICLEDKIQGRIWLCVYKGQDVKTASTQYVER